LEGLAVLGALVAAASSIVSCEKASASVLIAEKAKRIEVWQDTQRRWSELRAVGVRDCDLAVEFLAADRKDCAKATPTLTALERDNWKVQFLYLMEEIIVVTEEMPASMRDPWLAFVRVNLKSPAVCDYATSVVLPEGPRWYTAFKNEVNACRDRQKVDAEPVAHVTTIEAAAKTPWDKATTPIPTTTRSPPLLRAR
jgi:hypothetical protein